MIIEDGPDAYERLAGKLAIEALTPSSLVFSRDFRKSRVDLLAGRAVELAASRSWACRSTWRCTR